MDREADYVIVGLGDAAMRLHIPVLDLLGLKLGGVVDLPSRQVAINSVLKRRNCNFFSDLQHAIDRVRPGFVVICTPPSETPSYVTICVANQTSAMIEKPIVHSLFTNEISAVIEAENLRRSFMLMVVDNWPYIPIFEYLGNLIRSIGVRRDKIVLIFELKRRSKDYEDLMSTSWRNNQFSIGSSALWDLGWHCFSLASRILELEQDRLEWLPHLNHIEHDFVELNGLLNGIRLEIEINRTSTVRRTALRVRCEDVHLAASEGAVSMSYGTASSRAWPHDFLETRDVWFQAYRSGITRNYYSFIHRRSSKTFDHTGFYNAFRLSKLLARIENNNRQSII